MGRTKLKEKAIKLRKRGKTYTEIQSVLKTSTPKGTLSGWFKDVKLPPFYSKRVKIINTEHLERIRELALLANKRKQEHILKELRSKNEHLVRYLNKDVCKLLLSILYLGEGARHKGTRSLKLGSSDPKIIQLYLSLLKKCFLISKRKFRVSIGCRADQNVKELERYWQAVTKISYSQFYKTQIDKRTIGKKTKQKDYKGVCLITYFDTKIQLELEQLAQQIMGWIG